MFKVNTKAMQEAAEQLGKGSGQISQCIEELEEVKIVLKRMTGFERIAWQKEITKQMQLRSAMLQSELLLNRICMHYQTTERKITEHCEEEAVERKIFAANIIDTDGAGIEEVLKNWGWLKGGNRTWQSMKLK